MTTNENPTVSFSLRMPKDVADAIDERAKSVNLSRAQWMERSSRWVLQCLPTGITGLAKAQAMSAAPADVTGTERVDMGLLDVDGVARATRHLHRNVEVRDGQRICTDCGEVIREAD